VVLVQWYMPEPAVAMTEGCHGVSPAELRVLPKGSTARADARRCRSLIPCCNISSRPPEISKRSYPRNCTCTGDGTNIECHPRGNQPNPATNAACHRQKIALAKSKDSGSKSSKLLTLEGRTVSDICQKNPDVPAVWIGKLAELLAIENPTTNPNALPLDLVASRKRSSRQCGCHYCQVMWLSKEDGSKCKVAPPNRYTYHNLET
jgi:hypothetical protein